VQTSTAILLFTRTPKEEAHHKFFTQAGNSDINLSISTSLINRSVREVRKSGIPYFIIASDKQQGDSFRERLTNAFAEIFALGFERVIAVGNDSPQLNASVLKVAADSLRKNDLVLGPDQRGGTYLIGMARKCFDPAAFQEFRWNTSNLFSDFVAWGKENFCHLEILAELSDINTITDFNLLLRNKKISFSLLHQLQSLLASVMNSIADRITPFYLSLFRLNIGFRGPPEF
jgi:hypothetical protein